MPTFRQHVLKEREREMGDVRGSRWEMDQAILQFLNDNLSYTSSAKFS